MLTPPPKKKRATQTFKTLPQLCTLTWKLIIYPQILILIDLPWVRWNPIVILIEMICKVLAVW